MVWISLVSECPVCIRECSLNIQVRVIPVQLKAVVCVTHLKTSCRWVDIGKPGSLASKTRVISEWSAVPGGWAGLSQELGLAPVTRELLTEWVTQWHSESEWGWWSGSPRPTSTSRLYPVSSEAARLTAPASSVSSRSLTLPRVLRQIEIDIGHKQICFQFGPLICLLIVWNKSIVY